MMATQVRYGILGLGLELFARDLEYASDTVTAVKIPDGIKAGDLLGMLRNQHGVVLAGGQGSEMEGKIFRVGHLGFVDSSAVEDVMAALEKTLAGLRA